MLTYFLQVNLCWLLFYGLYYALLSRETFFKLNRIYLIISLLAGLVIPLSISKVEIVTQSPIVEMVQPIAISVAEFQQNIEINFAKPQTATWVLWSVLAWIYGLGMAFFLLKFGIGLHKIFQLYKQGEKQQNDGFKLIKTDANKTPFSFFNCIFINDKISENVDFQQIIAHEKAHVQQKHSFDIVGLEILRGVFWLSPLVHLYAQSLRNVHEYLADSVVLQNTEKKQYGRLLISQTVAANGLVLVNHFNFSQLKKRIIMMTRNRSQRWMLLKYMLVAPIFLLLVSFFIAPNNTLMHKTADFSDNVTATIDKMGETIQLKKQDLSANVAVSNKTELLILQEDSLRKPYSLSNPLARLGGKSGGLISKETMNNQTYLDLIQPTSQRPIVCAIQSFQLIRVPFGLKSNQESKNTGQKFNAETLALIQQAQNGDSYQFVNIKGRCPGDVAARDLGNLSFIIGENKEDADRLKKISTEPSKPVFMFTNGHVGGFISVEELRYNNEIIGYDFSENPAIYCDIISFTVTKTASNGTSVKAENKTGKFNADVKKLLEKAQVGDAYSFTNVRMKNSAKNKEVQAEDSRFIVNSLTNDSYVNKREDKPLNRVSYPTKDGIYTIVEQHPEFPQGPKAMFDWIQANLKYPEQALKAGVEGTVYIGFVVEKDGSLSKFEVKRGIGSGCNEEAVRLLKTSAKWTPGEYRGKVVRVAYTLPIKFKLPKQI